MFPVLRPGGQLTAISRMSSEGIWTAFPQIEIAEQGDLGAVVDDLHVDVQDEPCHWRVCELRWRNSASRSDETYRAQAAHITDPGIVCLIELSQCAFSGAGVGEGGMVGSRVDEIGRIRWAEQADEMRESPGDGGDRLALVRWRSTSSAFQSTSIPGRYTGDHDGTHGFVPVGWVAWGQAGAPAALRAIRGLRPRQR